MVGTGLFSRFSGYISPPQPSLMDEDGNNAGDGATLLGDEDTYGDESINEQMGRAKSALLKLDAEGFKPIEPPLEPEMDQPIKCPMPDYSSLQKDEAAWKELFVESSTSNKIDLSRKPGKNSEQASAGAEGKRHRLLKRDGFRSLSFRVPRTNFLRVFKDCRECEF